MESSRRYTHHGATDVSVHTTTTIGAVPQSVGTGAIPAPTLPPPPRNGGTTNHPIGVAAAAAAAAARAAPPVSLEASTAAAMATAAATTAACTQEPHAHPQQDSMEAAATPGVEQSKNTKPHTDPFAAAHNNNNNSNSSVSTSKAISSIAKNSTNSTITNNNYKTNNINETNTKQQPPQQQHRQRRRSCRFPGCDRVIKSQGHCQRHGARAKRCRFPGGCDKQAQGTHDGLCKRHWRAIMHCPEQEEEDDDDEEEDSDEPENPNNDEEERHGIGNTTTLRQQQGGAAIGATFHPKSAPQKRRRRRPPVPQGDSVYDAVVPQSIAFRPAAASLLHHGGATTTTTTGNTTTFSTRTTMDSNNNITNTNHNRQQQQQNTTQDEIPTPSLVPGAFPHNNNTFSNNSGFVVEEYGHPLSGTTTSAALSPDKNNMEGVVRLDSAGMDDDTAANNNIHNNHFGKGEQPSTTRQQSSLDFVRTTTNLDPWDVPGPPDGVAVMPLVLFLRQHAHQDAGWHRNQERRARGVHPVPSLSSQLEPWERQLALVEILLLSGGTPYADFRHLSHAWGREKGFHTVLANSVCDRRGEVERKRRSDAGKVLTVEERTALREERIKRSKASLESGTTSAAAVTATASSSVVPASTAISTASTTTAMDSKSTTKILASIAGAAAQVITIQTPLQL